MPSRPGTSAWPSALEDADPPRRELVRRHDGVAVCVVALELIHHARPHGVEPQQFVLRQRQNADAGVSLAYCERVPPTALSIRCPNSCRHTDCEFLFFFRRPSMLSLRARRVYHAPFPSYITSLAASVRATKPRISPGASCHDASCHSCSTSGLSYLLAIR